MNEQISKHELKVHSVYSHIRDGWNKFLAFPFSVIANIAVVEILILTLFPTLKNLPAIPFGLICIGIVVYLCYKLDIRDIRVQELKKRSEDEHIPQKA